MGKKYILIPVASFLPSLCYASGHGAALPDEIMYVIVACILALVAFFLWLNARVFLGVYSDRYSLRPALILFVMAIDIVVAFYCAQQINNDMYYFKEFDHHGHWYDNLSNLYSDDLRQEYDSMVQQVWGLMTITGVLLMLVLFYLLLFLKQVRTNN